MSTFRISCPNCGTRIASEFSYAGESVPFPEDCVETGDENYERVWLRANVLGAQSERWFHFAGCQRWVTVERNTLTNEVTRPG